MSNAAICVDTGSAMKNPQNSDFKVECCEYFHYSYLK